MLVFIVAVLVVLVLPSVIDLARALLNGVVAVGGYYVGEARTRLIRYSLIYLGIIAFLTVAAAIASVSQGTLIFGIVMLIMGCVLLPLQGALNKSINMINYLLPTGSKLSDPKVITISILVSLNLGLVALYFPGVYYSWYSIFFLGLMMVGVTVIVAFPSEKFLSKMVLGGMSVATFVLWIALALFPTEIEAAITSREIYNSNSGRVNIAEMLKIRPVQEVTSVGGASVWKVSKRWNGDPIFRSDGFPVVEPLYLPGTQDQMVLTMGTKFKTSNIEVKGLDAGEPLVQIFLQAADGTWVQVGDVGNMYIAVSKTNLAIAPAPVVTPTDNTQSPATKADIVVHRYTVSANSFLNTGLKITGKTVIIKVVSGSWDNGGSIPQAQTGGGLGPYPGTISSEATIGELIAKVGSGVHTVGVQNTLSNLKGELSLGMNDVPGLFKDNHGELVVEVTLN